MGIEVILPLRLYGQARQCSIDIDGECEVVGQTVGKADAAFVLGGAVEIICGDLKVEADVVRFEGRTWLEAAGVTSRPRLDLHLKARAEVGWGGVLATTYPWSRLPSSLQPPYSTPPADVLEALIDECWSRLPAGAAITLRTDYTNPDDDRLRWTDRQFPRSFPKLIELMIRDGLASSEKIAASNERKVRVRFSGSWEDLRRTMRGERVTAACTAFVKAARQAIG